MKLVITIDTEEDNWGVYNASRYSTDNIYRIPELQRIFDEFKVIPTYLITYPVATDKESIDILRRIHDEGKCEIGMHCHPWSTPPFEEERNERNSMLCNLHSELQFKKMNTLHEAITKSFGFEPKSFRAGRWGYGETVGAVLSDLNYEVETSITPFTNWAEYYGPNFSNMFPEPYKFKVNGAASRLTTRELLEVPATIGYLQKNFELCSAVDKLLQTKWNRYLHVKGFLSRLRLLNKVHLSPESSNSTQMINLIKVFAGRKAKIVNMFFHSTSLKAGLTSFVRTSSDEKQFLGEIRFFLSRARETGITGMRLSEAPKYLPEPINTIESCL